MNKLEEARNKIDQIDKEMLQLFEKRMATVLEVATYKKENNLPILDTTREKELIQKNLKKLSSPALKEYYELFFDAVLKASKEYQKDSIK